MTPRGLLLLAVWAGLVVGVGELGIWAARRYLFDGIIFFGPDILWMTPVADLILFAAVGLVLAAAVRLRPGPRASAAALGILLLLAMASWVLMFPRASRLSLLLLAMGMTTEAFRRLRNRQEWLCRMARRTTPWLAVLVLVLVLAVRGGAAVAERVAIGGLPAAAPGAPNVLLIILDTVRAASLSLYGRDRPVTPHLDRWAERGVVFERAFVTAPWTLSSHGSVFTGRLAGETGITWQSPMNDEHLTLSEALADRGYLTGGFVANLFYVGRQWGLARGFIHYEDFPLSLAQLALSASLFREVTRIEALRDLVDNHEVVNRKTGAEIRASFLNWERTADRPWFAFLNFYDAHEPYLPPSPYDTLFGPRRLWTDYDHYPERADRRELERMTPTDLQGELDAYEGAIRYLDDQLDLLLRELERRGELDGTVVIITADHGESFGEHLLRNGDLAVGHGSTLYTHAIQVPLLVLYPPAVPAGRRIAWAVSLQDVGATIFDLIRQPHPAGFPGRSFAHWDAPPPDADPVFSEIEPARQTLKSIVVGDLHYLENRQQRELFDLASDPAEQRSLAAGDTVRLAALRAQLAELVGPVKSPGMRDDSAAPTAVRTPSQPYR